ncbi:MAG: hypothetical protein DMF63_03590 [Acidobacteria bacterium]|nr:MAG: hypothetical protein DMF63_03590 [Acidobacteriota bacterium]
MVALAGPGKAAGELAVSGKSINGEAPFVFVNGELARSGRSVFSGSTITTSESTNAVINLSKLGKIELAPNTVLNLTFDANGISGALTSGTVSALGTSQNVNITTPNGKTVQLSAGQSVSAAGLKDDDKDDDDDHGGAAWWLWGGIFGAAAVVIIWTALSDGDIETGGGGTVISPTR